MTYFTSLDLHSGYHQLPLSEDASKKSAFCVPDGLWEYTRLPFGLSTAPAIFSRVITDIFRHLPFVRVYMDDLVIFSKTFEEHLEQLKQVFDKIRKYDIRLKMKKCQFGRFEINYLGH